MPLAGVCPYYLYEKSGVTHCECGDLRFPDGKSRRIVVYGYCGHPENYVKCPLKHAMDDYYERSL